MAGVMVIALSTYGVYRSIPAIGGARVAVVDSTQSIAILPFTNVGGDSTNEPFSDGIADALTTALGRVPSLTVTARTSAFTLKKQGLDARDIGQQLRVRYVVEGSVRRAESRRRVSADLIDVATGREVWSASFEHNAVAGNAFAIEDSITRSIVRQVLPHISRENMPATRRSAENAEAYDLYNMGRYFFEKRDSLSLLKAQTYFARAIRVDSAYAPAYAGLSDAYSHQAQFGFALPRANFPTAKRYISRALALDPTLAEVHNSLGFIALFYDYDFATAGREFDQAIALNSSYAAARLFHAWYYLAKDSVTEAIAEGRRAAELDPLSNLNSTRLVSFLFYAGRYGEALEQARQTFARDSNYIGVRLELALAYVTLGRCAEALVQVERVPAYELRGIVGYTYATCGRRAQALAELDHAKRHVPNTAFVRHYDRAVIQAGLGNLDAAMAELEASYVEREWAMFLLRLEPAFKDLRRDARFQALVRKVGLAA